METSQQPDHEPNVADTSFGPVTVRVGPMDTQRLVRFRGRLLARRAVPDLHMGRVHTIAVFETPKHAFAVRSKTTPEWSSWAARSPGDWAAVDWQTWYQESNLRLDVYQSLDDLRAHIDPELYAEVLGARTPALVEDLDI